MLPSPVPAVTPPWPRTITWFLPALLLCASAAATPDAAKPYTLYLGADINVEWDGAFHPVRDVQRESYVISPRDQPVAVPVVGRKPANLRIKKDFKLADRLVQVTGLQVERAFAPGSDPGRKFVAAASEALMAAPDPSAAARTLAGAQSTFGSQQESHRADPNPGTKEGLDTARAGVNSALMGPQAGANAAQSLANESDRLAGQMATEQEQFDAMEVKFRVSSAQPLADVYVVIMAVYREPGVRQGQTVSWVYATELDAIDDAPRTVRFKQGGLPPGFELLKHEVHFYSRGRELASTVADKAVPLTRDEAHEYLVIEYLTDHKGETVPAVLALGARSGEFAATYGAAQLQQAIFVKVDRNGLPGGVFLDEACIRSVRDPFLESVVREVRFKPALNSGKPVDGVASLKIADLAP